MPLYKVKKTDISWLTGIIEGEGSLLYYPEKKGKSGHHIWRFQVVNTDIDIINKCVKIFKKLNLRYSINIKKQQDNRKQCYVMQMSSLNHIQYLIEIISPYMVGEKRKNALLLSMLKPKKRTDNRGSNAQKHIKPVDDQLPLFH